jgi:toxin-antitoxin system PIN domain toxin
VIVVDVNVLVAMARTDHPDHERATEWWQQTVARGDTVTTPDLVWVGVVRILTHPRIFNQPSSVASAVAFERSVVAQPSYLPWQATSELMTGFDDLCTEANATGNLVTDAYIAAVARRFGARVATFDRDFRRFRVELDELV